MKVYRYMSLAEMQKLTSGCILANENGHSCKRTTSKGFCFLGEETGFSSFDMYEEEFTDYSFSPEECYQFLKGIVSDEVIVEFEVDPSNLAEAEGMYADPFTYDGLIVIKEYCANAYSIDTFHPIRYGMVGRFGGVDWYSWN